MMFHLTPFTFRYPFFKNYGPSNMVNLDGVTPDPASISVDLVYMP